MSTTAVINYVYAFSHLETMRLLPGFHGNDQEKDLLTLLSKWWDRCEDVEQALIDVFMKDKKIPNTPRRVDPEAEKSLADVMRDNNVLVDLNHSGLLVSGKEVKLKAELQKKLEDSGVMKEKIQEVVRWFITHTSFNANGGPTEPPTTEPGGFLPMNVPHFKVLGPGVGNIKVIERLELSDKKRFENAHEVDLNRRDYFISGRTETTFDLFPGQCPFEHDNIKVLHGVTPCPVAELPAVCICGAPLTYSDDVVFVAYASTKDDDRVRGYSADVITIDELQDIDEDLP